MARIRTIKPEFPHSESMGRVGRDARLLFIMLWTLVDDAGIARGNSRMLASLLFPYDDDAPGLIEGWLGELEAEGCVVRYRADGQSYLQICNWLNHQKIDKPTPSKLPKFDNSRDDSRILPVGREGKGIGEEGNGEEGNGVPAPQKAASADPGESGGNETALQAACKETWLSYGVAFFERYGTEPVRNAKVNALVKQLVKRLGAEEAPLVAAHFVKSNLAYYVQRGHAVDCLVADAEKVRTEWATGRNVTATRARQLDRQQANGSVVDEALELMGGDDAKTA